MDLNDFNISKGIYEGKQQPTYTELLAFIKSKITIEDHGILEDTIKPANISKKEFTL